MGLGLLHFFLIYEYCIRKTTILLESQLEEDQDRDGANVTKPSDGNLWATHTKQPETFWKSQSLL